MYVFELFKNLSYFVCDPRIISMAVNLSKHTLLYNSHLHQKVFLNRKHIIFKIISVKLSH